MNERYQVIIVGSGMAGLAAADLLGQHGLRVLVVDDNAHPGGQFLRQPSHFVGHPGRFEADPLKRRGLRLAQGLRGASVRFVNSAQVLGIFPERTLLVEHGNGHVSEYRADALILATGARERQLPFKGWTLPGVMATGAAQILIKSSGILPAKKTLIGGLGPLMLVLATQILTGGGKVQALLDQSTVLQKIMVIGAGPAIGFKLLEGALHLARLTAARVPTHQGVRIVEARGHGRLESVVWARADATGRIISGTEKIYSTQALAMGYGFTPNVELPQQAGCSLSYAAHKGGWAVDVDAAMATTVPDIYAVGETTGIAGAGKSFIEGRIAAGEILFRMGRLERRRYDAHMRPLQRFRQQQVRYGRFLNQLCRIPPDCYAEIPDGTIICRCEEIHMGDIRRQLAHGFATIHGIKRATRCTMGNCQGRTCGPILSDIIGAFTQRPPAAAGWVSARAPIKPVALGALARMSTGDAGDYEDQTAS